MRRHNRFSAKEKAITVAWIVLNIALSILCFLPVVKLHAVHSGSAFLQAMWIIFAYVFFFIGMLIIAFSAVLVVEVFFNKRAIKTIKKLLTEDDRFYK